MSSRTSSLRPIVVVALIQLLASNLNAQTKAAWSDSLKLRYMRIRARSEGACVLVSTSGSMDIEAHISPANVRRWIDTATAYAAAKPHRAKGQRLRYAWIPSTIGIDREITDRFDAFSFVIAGHGIPIFASEVPRIVKLLDSAAVNTLDRSGGKGACTLDPDR